MSAKFELVIAKADGIFPGDAARCMLDESQRIDRSIPIVTETEQIADRRNSSLNSRAQISDGSAARCSTL
jgi:hypothetical protein